MSGARNIHATAIVLGTRGFLFVGPSGCGKTASALACLAQAEDRGIFAAFVGDDQVLVSSERGCLVATAIDTIAGRAEIRGGGIVQVPAITAAVMDFAVQPVNERTSDRIPREDEQFDLAELGSLPLLSLPASCAETLDKLLRIAAERG